jgi:hypothetical protein
MRLGARGGVAAGRRGSRLTQEGEAEAHAGPLGTVRLAHGQRRRGHCGKKMGEGTREVLDGVGAGRAPGGAGRRRRQRRWSYKQHQPLWFQGASLRNQMQPALTGVREDWLGVSSLGVEPEVRKLQRLGSGQGRGSRLEAPGLWGWKAVWAECRVQPKGGLYRREVLGLLCRGLALVCRMLAASVLAA